MLTVGIVVDAVPGDDAHYRVSLRTSDGDDFAETASELVPRPLPLPAPGAGDLVAALRDALRVENAEAATLRELGKHLWDLVFAGGVGAGWAALAPPFRTVLDVRAPELVRLPWEVLQNKLRIAFTMEDRPFVRAPLDAKPRPPVDPPLRVLVVVGQPDDARLRWNEEVVALEVLGSRHPDRFHVEVLEAPTLTTLRERCRDLQPHVLHLVAHGKVVQGQSAVVVGEKTDTWLLDADTAINLLPNTIPMVVLNACHTGDVQALDGAFGLGEAFRDNGAVATVCMQGAVLGTAAAAFSEAFYQSLLDGRPLDSACVAGRLAIAQGHDSTADRWLPSLTLGVAPGPMLGAPAIPAPPVPLGAIDRAPERRKLLFALEPPDGTAHRRQAAIVRGAAGVGKTWVAQAVGHVFRSRGGRVRYVDLRGSSTRTWLDVLRAVRGTPGQGEPSPFDALPPEPFADFNAAVNAVAGGRPPPAEPAAAWVADAGERIGAVTERTLDHIAALFGIFRDTLARVAAPGRMLLILDHFEHVDTDDLKLHLLPKLLTPIASDQVPGVGFVLVLRDTPDALREQGLVAQAEDVPVVLPAKPDFARLAAVYRDVCVALGMLADSGRQQYDTYVKATTIDGPWHFQKLTSLAKAVAI